MFIKGVNEINLHHPIAVRLTQEGVEYFIESEIASGTPEVLARSIVERKCTDGWYRFMMWEFMNIFGPAMQAGVMQPQLIASNIRILEA